MHFFNAFLSTLLTQMSAAHPSSPQPLCCCSQTQNICREITLCDVEFDPPTCPPVHPPCQPACHPSRIDNSYLGLLPTTFRTLCGDISKLISSQIELINTELKRSLEPRHETEIAKVESALNKLDNDVKKVIDEAKEGLLNLLVSIINDNESTNRRIIETAMHEIQNIVNNKVTALKQLDDTEIVQYIRNVNGGGPSQQMENVLTKAADKIKTRMDQSSKEKLDAIRLRVCEAYRDMLNKISILFKRATKNIKSIINTTSNKEMALIILLINNEYKGLMQHIEDMLCKYEETLIRKIYGCGHEPIRQKSITV